VKEKGAMPVLFLMMFLVMVGFGIIIPVLPFYAKTAGANPAELGLLMAVYSLMQLIFSPMWGKISDAVGRKPVLMIGISGLALSFFMMAMADKLWMLFAARILGGFLSAANMPVTMAYVADITTPENRSKGMGLVGAAVGLGFIFGPAIGGVFSKTSLSLPFYIAGTSSLLTLLLVIFVLKESLPKEARQRAKAENEPSRFSLLKGPVALLFFLQLFVSISLSGLEATFAYFASEKAGLTSVKLGYIFMIMGLAGAVVQGGLIGVLTDKLGEAAVIRGGIAVSFIGLLLILFTKNFATAALFLTIFGLGNGVIRPTVSSLLTKISKTGHGGVTGLLSSFDSLGRIIGPPLGGALFQIYSGLPYLAGAFFSAVAYALFQFAKIDRTESLS